MSYTKGRLVFYSSPKSDTLEIRDTNGDPIIHWMGFDSCNKNNKEKISNGLRLVACWNGCEGINPDAVKDMVEALKFYADQQHIRMEDGISVPNLEWTAFDIDQVETGQRARAALKKAEE